MGFSRKTSIESNERRWEGWDAATKVQAEVLAFHTFVFFLFIHF